MNLLLKLKSSQMQHPWSQNPGSFRVYDILVSLSIYEMLANFEELGHNF